MKTDIGRITPSRRDVLRNLGLGTGMVVLGGGAFAAGAAAKTADPHFPVSEQVARLEADTIYVDYKIAGLGNKFTGSAVVSAQALGEVEFNCQTVSVPRTTRRVKLDASGEHVFDVPRPLRNGRIVSNFDFDADLEPEATAECPAGYIRRGGFSESIASVTLNGKLYSGANGTGSLVATLDPVTVDVEIVEE